MFAAKHFLRRYPKPPPCRFDAVLLQAESLIWLKAAFEERRSQDMLQRYDSLMLEQRIEQQFIDSADLKYQ